MLGGSIFTTVSSRSVMRQRDGAGKISQLHVGLPRCGFHTSPGYNTDNYMAS